MNRKDIAVKEGTPDPIFLFQVRVMILNQTFWKTTGVYATRKEGEFFGESTKHRLGKGRKGIDWRVHCISLECDSELAEILTHGQGVEKSPSVREGMNRTP